MKRKQLFSVGLFSCLLSWGVLLGQSGCGVPSNGNNSQCTYEGKTYLGGTSFASTDGCNTCSCIGGQVVCTRKACSSKDCSVDPKACLQDEFCSYPEGQCVAGTTPGQCQKKPQGCTGDYTPVCGCDGNTYSNGCIAAAAGVSVKSKGECTTPPKGCTYNNKSYKDKETFPSTDGCNMCTCSDGNIRCTEEVCTQACGSRGMPACPTGSYCKFDESCGATDKGGVCETTPKACPDNVDPVCGCDDKTYSNACEAAASGISVKSKGACVVASKGCTYNDKEYKDGETFPDMDGCNTCTCNNGNVSCTEKACPQTCGSRGRPDCPTGSYCKFDETCGATDKGGICETIPQACPRDVDPVCGCDDKTYNNACSAAASGVSVKSKGACPSNGCSSDTDCLKGQVCVNAVCKDALSCTYAGAEYKHGSSFPASDGCNTCSCYNGAVRCTKIACSKVCANNQDCAMTEYCALTSGTCSGSGACKLRPSACTQVYDPVCGCDGKTYGNACGASSSGINVKSTGACSSNGCSSDADCLKGQVCVNAVCKAALACTYAGAQHPHGSSFPASDGCNTCTCNNGTVGCTKIACPKTCTLNKDCALTEYCALSSGTCSGSGSCKARPSACPAIYSPVCGCNGMTYSNSCNAAASGLNVKSTGACKTPAP